MADSILFSSLDVLDALSAHIAVLDESGTIIAVNKAWCHLAGANHFHGIGHGLGTNYISLCESASGDGTEAAMAIARGIREVIARQREQFSLEYACNSPEGERWFVVHVTRFADSQSVRVLVSHENITGRKQAEENPWDERHFAASLLEVAQVIVVVLDLQGRIVRFNRYFQELSGYHLREVQEIGRAHV